MALGPEMITRDLIGHSNKITILPWIRRTTRGLCLGWFLPTPEGDGVAMMLNQDRHLVEPGDLHLASITTQDTGERRAE